MKAYQVQDVKYDEIEGTYFERERAESHFKVNRAICVDDEQVERMEKHVADYLRLIEVDIDEIPNQKIYVYGQTIGYQFNRDGFGARVVRRTVKKIRERRGKIEGVTKIKERKVCLRYDPDHRSDWLVMFTYEDDAELDTDYSINFAELKDEDPADMGAPREFPPEPPIPSGTKVRVSGIIDETRMEYEGKLGEVAGEVSKALGSDDIAYRVVFTNGYSGLVFHNELELIPLEEIIGEMRKRAAEINSLCDEMLLRLD